jgi:hypothetical protein
MIYSVSASLNRTKSQGAPSATHKPTQAYRTIRNKAAGSNPEKAILSPSQMPISTRTPMLKRNTFEIGLPAQSNFIQRRSSMIPAANPHKLRA